MRILHCCLAAFYIDNYSYQENILPKMHKLQGHEVAILASTETYINNSYLGYVIPRSYNSKDGIPVTRLPYSKWLPQLIARKLRLYEGIKPYVEEFKPDLIFLHDCQFISIITIASYARRHRDLKVFVDGHTDFINSARGWISKRILHGIIYKWCAKKIEPYTVKFYGVLPLRVDFIIDIYGIPREKTELLVLGADQSIVDLSKRKEINKAIRSQLNINESDFVIITGGKLDYKKNIHILMQAVDELQEQKLKLIVFGVPSDEIKNDFEKYSKSKSIIYTGWLDSELTTKYFLAADLAFFPGTHSVLWEQAIGLGLPGIFKKWNGIQHIDLKGNCLFIDSNDLTEIKRNILLVLNDKELFKRMKKVALERGVREFSYFEIAKRAINT